MVRFDEQALRAWVQGLIQEVRPESYPYEVRSQYFDPQSGETYSVLVRLHDEITTSDFNIVYKPVAPNQLLLEVFPPLTFGSVSAPSASHGWFGRAVRELASASDESLVHHLYPGAGVRRSNPIYDPGAPEVEVVIIGERPPAPMQDVRAAALFHLLERGGVESSYVRAASALAPDVVYHLFRLLGDDFHITADNRLYRGNEALARLLLPYDHIALVVEAGVAYWNGQPLFSVPEIASHMWRCIVNFCRQDADEALMSMFAQIPDQNDIQDSLEALIQRMPQESYEQLLQTGHQILLRLLEAQAERAQRPELIKPLVSEAVEWLIRARRNVRGQVLYAQTIGDSYPQNTQALPYLMARLLPESVLGSARKKFPFVSATPIGTRITEEELMRRMEHGAIDIDTVIRQIYRGLPDETVFIVDVSGSMEVLAGIIQRMTRDFKTAAGLKEGWVVILFAGEIGIYRINELPKHVPVGGNTALFPALMVASELNKKAAIVITDWAHNQNQGWVTAGADLVGRSGAFSVSADRPVRPATHLLLFNADRRPDLPDPEGSELPIVMDVEISPSDIRSPDFYPRMLKSIAEFARAIHSQEIKVKVLATEHKIQVILDYQ